MPEPEVRTMSAAGRYEQFQKDAVAAILADFSEQATGRYLLVIPTGGGKTFTAVKAVSALYDRGVINPAERVLWLVHRDELRTQAAASFEAFAREAGRPKLPPLVDMVMLGGLKDYLQSNPGLRFAVVDEAHHVAAASYLRLFEKPGVGILGLTATPSRHDGKPLQFQRESYSIGFPELVELGVLLRPEVITVVGGKYDLVDIGTDSDSLEVLNNAERNARIVAALFEHKAKLNKAIVYVGTRKHAQDLYELLKASPLAQDYESIGMILGAERRRYIPRDGRECREERKDFISAMKASSRALLVNVDVLTEGYDDPTVNAVVMARPTNSKLVYMQALGRAVRLDPGNPDKAAFVLEVCDDLPNIRYRIDNRWLFSDVSDSLEPAVEDVEYSSVSQLPGLIEMVFERYSVPADARALPPISPRDRVTMLLFKVYRGEGKYSHLPIVITNETRQAAANFFNFLSDRMQILAGLAVGPVIGTVKSSVDKFPLLTRGDAQREMVQAMENAWEVVSEKAGAAVAAGSPWVSFVSFRFRAEVEALSSDLLEFTKDMLNCESVRDWLRRQEFRDGYVLLRLPLPLQGTVGSIHHPDEFERVRETIDELRKSALEADPAKQWKSASAILGAATLPIAHWHVAGLATIVREHLDYFRILRR